MKLGLGSYTYAWAVGVPGFPAPRRPLTALDLVEKAALLRVRVVQIADNLPLHREPPATIDALNARAAEHGIELELGTAGTNPEHLRAYVALAHRLRSRVLRTIIDTPTDQPTPDEATERLRAVLPDCEANGVTLAVENHDRFKATTLRAIIHRLHSRHVGVCLDTANSLGCLEGPEHVLDILGPRVVNLHIKDVRVTRLPHLKGFTVEGTPAGAGQIEIPALLSRLRGFGVDPNAIVELWPPLDMAFEETLAQEDAWARQSITYLRSLIPE